MRSSQAAALSCIRFKDVAVLQGPPLMGLVASWSASGSAAPWKAPLLLAAAWCLVAHVFCLNDYAEVETDLRDANKADGTFVTRGVSRAAMARLAIGLGGLSLLLLIPLPAPSFIAALGFAILSVLYSHPLVAAKGIAVVSSVIHVTAGALLFLLGYGVCGVIDVRGVLLGTYFGLVFAAGHLAQEVGDSEADGRSGIRTNAVCFGRRRTFVTSFILFTASYLLIAGLGLAGVVPRGTVAIAALYPAHAVLFWRTLRGGLGFDVVSRYRRQYRLLFLPIGLIMCIAFLLGRTAR